MMLFHSDDVITAAERLLRTDKDEAYDLAALLVSLPVGMVGWLEALSCDSFLVAYGGHVWYDLCIPLSMLVYYGFILHSHKAGKGGEKDD